MTAIAAILDVGSEQFVIFDLQDTLMFPTKFQVNLPFGSGEVVNNFFKMTTMAAILDFQSKLF